MQTSVEKTMTKVDDLITQGAVQQSRKYRRVFVPPQAPLELLKARNPEIYDKLVEEALKRFEGEVTSYVWSAYCHEHTVVLTSSEYDEFREKTTGKKPWTFEGKQQCEDCKSFGHMHRRSCVNYRGNK